MLKAVIFDDEPLVLQGLQNMIDWPRFGVELVGTATDGLAALELFRRIRPDIVLTDIRMPGLDGLQLIETVSREAPDTAFIVFSGFNEFEYVKRAIRLGVADYLEKPITVLDIEHAVGKLTDRLRRERESRRELLEKATLDLLLLGRKAEDKWRAGFGPEAERITHLTVLASPEPLALTPAGGGRAVFVRGESDFIVAIFHAGMPPAEFWEQLEKSAADAGFPVGASRTRAGIEHAPVALQEAREALRLAQRLQKRGIVRLDETVFADADAKRAAVERAIRYIEKNLARDLSLQEIAEHLDMNASYLSVVFKEVTGETYIRYLTRLRMERAKKLLALGMKVTDVSERVGYHTYRHFCEKFKAYTGMTPGQFRQTVDESQKSRT